MKKLVLSCIAILFLLSLGAYAEKPIDPVEIVFQVGDATLLVNGNPLTVEKPYVTGNGVTLVPVRVITESFGAEVEWEDVSQRVTLRYGETKIELKIADKTAKINGKPTELMTAPQLTKSGYTMVPLRFISEAFEAEVTYDEQTERITVYKPPVIAEVEGFNVFYADNRQLALPLPDAYRLAEDENRTENGWLFEPENAEKNDVWTIREFCYDSYNMSPKHYLEAESRAQNLRRFEKILSLDKVQEMQYHGKDMYFYDIYEWVTRDERVWRARKILFEQGNYCRFVLITAQPGDEVYSKEGTLTGFAYDSYELFIPKEFREDTAYLKREYDLSGKSRAAVSVRFYRMDSEKDDAEQWMIAKRARRAAVCNAEMIAVSEVEASQNGKNPVFSYTEEYRLGGVVHHVLYCYDSFAAVLEISVDTVEDAAAIAEGFWCSQDKADLENMPVLPPIPDELPVISEDGENKESSEPETVALPQSVKTESFTFALPQNFTLYQSPDGRYGAASDADSMLSLTFMDYATEIWSDDHTSDYNLVPGIGIIGIYSYEKLTPCEELRTVYWNYLGAGWQKVPGNWGNREKDSFCRIEKKDYAVISKSMTKDVCVYHKLCYFRTKAENTRYARQKLHTFIFSYTNLDNAAYVNAVIDAICKSVQENTDTEDSIKH